MVRRKFGGGPQSPGQAAPHVTVSPSGHMTGLPAPHETMSQSCVPATPAFGQRTTQVAPEGQVVWQGPLAQAK